MAASVVLCRSINSCCTTMNKIHAWLIKKMVAMRSVTRYYSSSDLQVLTWLRMISCCRCLRRSRSICNDWRRSFCWQTCRLWLLWMTPAGCSQFCGSIAPDVGVLWRCVAEAIIIFYKNTRKRFFQKWKFLTNNWQYFVFCRNSREVRAK